MRDRLPSPPRGAYDFARALARSKSELPWELGVGGERGGVGRVTNARPRYTTIALRNLDFVTRHQSLVTAFHTLALGNNIIVPIQIIPQQPMPNTREYLQHQGDQHQDEMLHAPVPFTAEHPLEPLLA